MTDYNLSRIVSPKRDDGEPDMRYAKLVRNALEKLSPTVAEGLAEGYKNLVNHKNSTFPYVQKLMLQILDESEKYEDWQQNGMRKQLREVAAVFGYSAFDTSKMVGSVELEHKLLSQGSQAAGWYKDQNLSVKYELSKMNEDGFNHVWVELSKWGSETISTKQLKALVSQYPKEKARFGGGRPSGSSSSKPKIQVLEPTPVETATLNTFTDEVYEELQAKQQPPLPPVTPSSNTSILHQIKFLVNQLDLDSLYVSPEQQAIIQPIHDRFETLVELSSRVPKYKRTTV